MDPDSIGLLSTEREERGGDGESDRETTKRTLERELERVQQSEGKKKEKKCI